MTQNAMNVILMHLRSFVKNFAILKHLRVFCVKFLPPKLRSRKRFDKYHVWAVYYFIWQWSNDIYKYKVILPKNQKSKFLASCCCRGLYKYCNHLSLECSSPPLSRLLLTSSIIIITAITLLLSIANNEYFWFINNTSVTNQSIPASFG